MATVDPERDTGPVLVDYLANFFKQKPAQALRTDDAARLQTVADGFGVQYEVQKSADGKVNDLSITLGSNFAGNKGNGVVYLGYKKEDAIMQNGPSQVSSGNIAPKIVGPQRDTKEVTLLAGVVQGLI